METSAALEQRPLEIIAVAVVVLLLLSFTFLCPFSQEAKVLSAKTTSFLKFFYASFLKPHQDSATGTGQQAALESFYKAQADVYDASRAFLLRGREDMLGLVAAQLRYKEEKKGWKHNKLIWIDVGGGTGWNIEEMSRFLDVPSFFSHVYLVDLSPSLLNVAKKRFERLGWNNVTVICQDARTFRLAGGAMADLITLSYSLSMIPDFYSVVDSLSGLLSSQGFMGVCDFYVQSIVDVQTRNYTGGVVNRHVNWLGRVFWRAWFDTDRVGLEAARRDYLEYRFGTVLSISERNLILGGLIGRIPYYIWVGKPKFAAASDLSVNCSTDVLEQLDAACTESPYLSPRHHRELAINAVELSRPEIRSKAYECAVVNLAGNLPLPSTFYSIHHWRIHYDEHLPKHTQFHDEYIYAFNWECPLLDNRLLKIGENDVILTITSAGDNLLSYLNHNPKRIHAVDLNPAQNHLLELKIAALSSEICYNDFWKLFGLGKHADFRNLLISRLSPHLSSHAYQFWLKNSETFTSSHRGLYETGGGGHAIRLVRWLFYMLGLSDEVKRLCAAKTLNEQREVWRSKVRRVLLNRFLNWTVVGTEAFAWKAAGVPPAQRKMIQLDYLDQEGLTDSGIKRQDIGGNAIWEYLVNTLDPVAENTLLSRDNHFYLLCLLGHYTRECHPDYLTPRSYQKLSRPNAFDGLRIHTDELNEVVSRMAPRTLTIAVLMDSLDWFAPKSTDATIQVQAVNRALKLGGRVLLRSAGLKPWYIRVFEDNGFVAKRVNARFPGTCVDRVNMYASCWICTKTEDLASLPPSDGKVESTGRDRTLSSTSSVVEQLEL
ncbi:MAG: hypothetical protein M1835_004411 [Candelina submexicana]|nr:MAG: hypothetical protein M1835_004411 [Candelina submexicana]